MAHQVLSRKYRPQRFSDVVGQEHVARILQNALSSGRVGHAYLLVGPRGVGKTTTARIFARALNCEMRIPHDDAVRGDAVRGDAVRGDAVTGDAVTEKAEGGDDGSAFEPCGTCSSCVDIAAGSDLDVVEMDAASNNAVDDVRALREQVGYATVRSRYRIWIVDEVHMLSLPAFNAFLKTLEEPPAQVKFLFCTTEEHKLPDTFRSRCQRVEFRPIDEQAMAQRLENLAAREDVPLGEGLALAIAHGALGGLRDAESQLEQLIAARGSGDPISCADLDALSGRAPADLLDTLCAAVDARDAAAALDAVDGCLAAGSKPGVLVDQWLERLRELLVTSVRTPADAPPAASVPVGASPVGPGPTGRGYARVARAIDVLLGKRAHLRAGADGGLVLQVAAVELARLPDARDLDALIAALRGEASDSPAAPEAAPPAASLGAQPGRAAAAVTAAPERAAVAPGGSAPAAPTPAAPSAEDRAPVAPAPAGTTPAAAARPAARSQPQRKRTLNMEALREAWPEIMQHALRRSRPLARALEVAEPRDLRGDVVILSLTQTASGARGTLLRREVQLAFGQIVRELLGTFVRMELRDVKRVTPVTEPIGENMRTHPSVQQVTEATGGRLLNIERREQDAASSRAPGPHPGGGA